MAKSNDNGPSYYRRGKTQVWDFIRDQGLNFHLGNVIKYVSRAGYKTNGLTQDTDITDLQKAIHYLQNEIEFRTSERVQRSLSGTKLPELKAAKYAEAFDR